MSKLTFSPSTAIYITTGSKPPDGTEDASRRMFKIARPGQNKRQTERAFRRFCRRPHVYRGAERAWCGLNSDQAEQMYFLDDVPPHAGYCAHCRAAYRRSLRARCQITSI